jgi:tRNA(fMet)-specific endonuclease VapC
MYLLDTNICIYLIKKKYPVLIEKVLEKKTIDIAISAVTVAELEYGIANSFYPKKNRDTLLEFLTPFEIISFSQKDCENFGFLRVHLKKKGTPIGPYDLQIAAQCISRDLCIVTNNVKEFERVPGIKIETWIVE